LGRTALTSFGVQDTGLTLLRHEANTTFRVETVAGRFLLRINRPNVHTPETIESEMAWLTALRRETDLGVPEPVRSRDGPFVVVTEDAGVPVPHACVLMRWLDGRFSDRRLTPAQLRRVGVLEAHLHDHARELGSSPRIPAPPGRHRDR